MSQEIVGRRIGVTQSHYGKIERGIVRANLIQARKLMGLFELELRDLIPEKAHD